MGVITLNRRAAKPKEKDLSIRGHLEEIRQRLVKSAIFIVLTTIASFVYARHIFDFFTSRAPEHVNLVQLQVTELIAIYMKICLYSGIVLALPFLIYQFVMFLNPALTGKEKGYLYLLLPGVLLCFFAGASFAYFIFLPSALNFLLNFPLMDGVDPMISINNYMSVVIRILVAIGLLFELPVLCFFFAKIGMVNHRQLAKYWRIAFVGAFVVAAFITPTVDPINQTLVAVPIIILYGLGIVLAWLARRNVETAV